MKDALIIKVMHDLLLSADFRMSYFEPTCFLLQFKHFFDDGVAAFYWSRNYFSDAC